EVPVIYVRTRLEIRERGANVVGEISRCGRSSVTAGLAEAPVIHAQNRDAASAERIGNLSKRTVAAHTWNCLVPILESRAGDHHNRGNACVPTLRHCESSGEYERSGSVYSHVFAGVRCAGGRGIIRLGERDTGR